MELVGAGEHLGVTRLCFQAPPALVAAPVSRAHQEGYRLKFWPSQSRSGSELPGERVHVLPAPSSLHFLCLQEAG